MKLEAPFTYDFVTDRKAAVTEAADGLTLEGYASTWDVDRQDEAFKEGAFAKGLQNFMRNPVLLFHHQADKALGKVEEFEERPDGLWVKAHVDPPAPNSWAEDVYNKIKSETIRAFSVGGRFKRELVNGMPKIHTADLMELSVTPLPVNAGGLFTVAKKAFGEDPALDEALVRLTAVLDDYSDVLADAKAITGSAD